MGFNFSKIVAAAGNEYMTKAGDIRGITDEWISTGSYALNALISGDIFKGIPNNKATMFAGIESVGKSLFTKFICNNAMKMGYRVVYFETEGAVDEDTFKPLGWVKDEHYQILPVKTIEDLRTQAYSVVEKYKEYYKKEVTDSNYKDRAKLLFVVDSIGMLSSKGAEKNLDKGEVKRDMTKQQQLRELFRDLCIDLSVLKIPFIPVNHVYEVIGAYVRTQAVSGGGGGKYGASTIISLKKKAARNNDKKQIGAIITANNPKSRKTVENTEVEIYLNFEKGINPYYGLDKFLEDETIIKRKSPRSPEYLLVYKGQNEKGEYPSVNGVVWKHPEVINEILPLINEKVKELFEFGGSGLADDGSFADVEEEILD